MHTQLFGVAHNEVSVHSAEIYPCLLGQGTVGNVDVGGCVGVQMRM